MRGYDEYNFPAFFRESARLRALGHTVFCPAESSVELAAETGRSLSEITFEEFMRESDLPAIVGPDAVDAVVVMPGWRDSLGACAEVFVARVCGIEVLDLDLQPVQGVRPSVVLHDARLHG
jgi:hypothetical protein